ncbi:MULTISPECIES: PP2C family protein-serine/threonine phosphatase [Actinosynnema]|uniref:PP2C family protein-serine/threonine phosphatase n=1 Tax=Actinosynnema TaxID=40566 RepID=UPI0020A4FE40|nr:PP2C family protein-serine/threonine phosphatase [Actinosynnema pretiosum]MCP2096361.1 Stage II sporulation protein E (SpoIIE) [Actinosynnema pretiosum]
MTSPPPPDGALDRAALEQLPYGFGLAERTSSDPDAPAEFRLVRFNTASAVHAGLGERQGRTHRELMAEAEAREWTLMCEHVWRTGETTRLTRHLPASDLDIDITAYPVALDGTRHVGVLAADVSPRTAEQAIREREQRRLAEVAITLQHAILGPTDGLPAGVAARYRPAVGPGEPALSGPGHPGGIGLGPVLQVGGDFHDVVALPGERCALLVGDVVGKDLAAAAVMGQLRSAARALLLQDNGPAAVLTALDTFAERLPGALCTTVLCLVVHTGTGHVDYASAGHLPALCAHDGGYRELGDGLGPPLAAVPGAVRTPASALIPPGATLLLYTDGLVERRDRDLDEGITRAGEVLAASAELDVEALADLLLRELPPAVPPDDTALLVYRHRP